MQILFICNYPEIKIKIKIKKLKFKQYTHLFKFKNHNDKNFTTYCILHLFVNIKSSLFLIVLSFIKH